jgi:hypothetical protein
MKYKRAFEISVAAIKSASLLKKMLSFRDEEVGSDNYNQIHRLLLKANDEWDKLLGDEVLITERNFGNKVFHAVLEN